MVITVRARDSGEPWKPRLSATGTSPVCQSLMWMMSGTKRSRWAACSAPTLR